MSASSRESDFILLEAKFPGCEAALGMEHSKQLSDALYQRWADGLRRRWPAV